MGEFVEASHAVDGRRLRRSEREGAGMMACIDEPESGTVEAHGSKCWFAGWVASAHGPAKVVVHVAGREAAEFETSKPRPDVVESLAPRFRVADERCGFEIQVGAPPPGRRRQRITLEFTDGRVLGRSRAYRVAQLDPEPLRGEYKRVWEAAAGELDAAKHAVAGYTDEQRLEETGRDTLAMLDQTVGIRPEDVVLEIGCGIGRVGRFVAPRCRQWIGTDVSEQMLGYARERLDDLDNVELVPTSGWDLSPIPGASVDVVYCTVVFMHLDDWDRYTYVREAFRVLRPGGRLFVDNFDLTNDDGWALFVDEGSRHHPARRPPQMSRASTPAELETYLARAGFVDIELRTGGFWIWAFGRRPAGD